MAPRRIVALGLRGTLASCCAVLIHGVVHGLGSRSFIWDSPAHLVMLLIAGALIAGIAVPLGLAGPAPDRRRRLALVHAALGPPNAARFATDLLSQAGLAVAIFLVEGDGLAPDRLATAIVCGLVALVIATSLLYKGGERIVALLVELASAESRESAPPLPSRPAAAWRSSEPYHLFVPTRPPPLAP